MTKGFVEFAADDAIMNHGDSLVKGKSGIRNFYELRKMEKNKLEWNAEFVDAAVSGDMGYTYGQYTYTTIDSTGREAAYKGIFSSVWKNKRWKREVCLGLGLADNH